MNWQQKYCPNVEFLLKADDDTVVHLQRLNFFIEKYLRTKLNETTRSVAFCKHWSGVPVRRDVKDKW